MRAGADAPAVDRHCREYMTWTAQKYRYQATLRRINGERQAGRAFANPAEWRERGDNPARRHERHRVANHRALPVASPAFPGQFFFSHLRHLPRKTCY